MMDVLPEYLFAGTSVAVAHDLWNRASDMLDPKAKSTPEQIDDARHMLNRALVILGGPDLPWSMPAPVDTEVEDYTSSVRPAFIDRDDRRARVWGWVLNGALFACVVVSLYLFLYFAAPLVGAR